MECWSWFRLQIIDLYQMNNLPETFSATEGNVEENHALYEDDDGYDFIPAEFNIDAYTQEIIFRDQLSTLTVTIVDDCIHFFSFRYENETAKITLHLSSRDQYLEMHEDCPHKNAWLSACNHFNAPSKEENQTHRESKERINDSKGTR